MSIEALGFVAVLLGMFVGFATTTYVAIAPLRLLLRLGPRSGVDVLVGVVFAVFLLFMLALYFEPHTTVSWVALLALPVCLGGLLFLGVGLFEAPKRTDGGERRDRLVVGMALMATAFVIVYLGTEQYGLFSDSASSVSHAPGP
jgi:hypothetical protein